MFVQRLNILTGEAEWVVSEAAGDGDPDDDSSDFVASSSYLDMLADTYRNVAYRIALEKTASAGDHVLDIGTGTGLLAMMAARIVAPGAARHMPKPGGPSDGTNGSPDAAGKMTEAPPSGRVTACEVFPPMASLARRVIAANGMENAIKVVGKRSSDTIVAGCSRDPSQFSQEEDEADMHGKADVLVTEIFDSELLGEGLLPTLRDAVPRLLRKGAAVVPARARCFFQLVECEFLASCSPYCCRSSSCGAEECGGEALQTMRELHVSPLADEVSGKGLVPLAPPVELLSFELARPPCDDVTQSSQVTITKGGNADAILFWWQLEMDSEAEVLVSTAPPWITEPEQGADRGPLQREPTGLRQGWRDHWKTCWCAVGPSSFRVQAGDLVDLTAQQSEINVTAGAALQRPPPLGAGSMEPVSPFSQVTLQELRVSSPNRVNILKDEQRWTEKYFPALKGAVSKLSLHHCSNGMRCLVLGDSTPLVESLARMDTVASVVALQDNTGSRNLLLAHAESCRLGSKIAAQGLRPFLIRASQASNKGSKAEDSSSNSDSFQLVTAEPFYRLCEGLLPWASLRFWHEVDLIRESGVLHPSAALVPAGASIWGVCVTLPELWRTRASLSRVEGLDLSLSNPLLRAASPNVTSHQPTQESSDDEASAAPCQRRLLPMMPCAAWQCGAGFKELTERVRLLDFDFYKSPETREATRRATVLCDGECHALLLYIDYGLDGSGHRNISGAPQGCLPSAQVQALQLLPSALDLKADPSIGSSSDRLQPSSVQGRHGMLQVGPDGAGAAAAAVDVFAKWSAEDGSLSADIVAAYHR